MDGMDGLEGHVTDSCEVSEIMEESYYHSRVTLCCDLIKYANCISV